MQKLKIKNQNYKSKFKIFEFCIVILIFAFCILNFIGCATVPTREALPTFNLNGTPYVSLVSLCEAENLVWEYDTFTKAIVLSKNAHKINLMVGETLVLVDGSPQYLKAPVDIYRGEVALPYRFKEQILDVLFKERYPHRREVLPVSGIKRVVIDAGHGGKDPGAIGRNGLREKDVNLDIAMRLSKLLKANGLDVIMTRSADTFISLSRRADIANNFCADLFISIHSNANRVRSLNGLEVYYISPNIGDSKRALNFAEDGILDLDKGCFAYSPSLNLKAIVWDMINTSNRAESIKLARYICRAVGDNLDTKVLGIKGAPFYVLKGTHMPAILIETGFVSNHNEERLMRNSYYRQQIAETIAQGMQNYIREFILMAKGEE